jgi:hypothetical protein
MTTKSMTTSKKAPASTLVIKTDEARKLATTPAQIVSRHAATVAAVQAATGMEPWLKQSVGKPDITALMDKIREQTDAMQRGDMTGIESMLFAQALTLQATFTALSRRAAVNAGEYIGATDTYLKLALKAQGQCRATLETLANIKSPRPIAFVKQANIANGPLQVNNGTPEPNDPRVRAREENENAQNELLTDPRATHENPMDTKATSAASASNSNVATMETGHRATHD